MPPETDNVSLDRLRKHLNAVAPKNDSVDLPDRYGAVVWDHLAQEGWCEHDRGPTQHRNAVALHAELGHAMVSTPHLSSVVMARPLLRAAGAPESLVGTLAADTVISVALDEPGRLRFLDGWTSKSDGDVIEMHKTWVPELARADLLLVGVERNNERALALVGASQVRDEFRALSTLANEPVFALNVSPRAIERVGEWPLSRASLVDSLLPAAACTAAAAAAAALRCIGLTVAYVNDRLAFGQPVGSFQAVQHNLAKLQTDAIASERMARYAAWALDARSGQAARLCASAFVFATETFNHVAARCLRYHGGHGYLLTTLLPDFYRRAKSWQMSLGGPDFWLAVVCDTIAADPTLSDRIM